MSSEESFYNYKRYRYLTLNALLVLVLLIIYIVDSPLGGRNGGTVVGYTYGIIAALGILYLMWYGVRRRAYYSAHTTLKGVLSAHAWLGIALAIIVPLHSGFSFGFNVHTLAYVLMMVVIISGVIGAIFYVDLAPRIRSHRGGGTIKKHLEQLRILSQDIESSVKGKSDRLVDVMHKLNFEYRPSIGNSLFGRSIKPLDKKHVSELLQHLSENEYQDGLKLVSLIDKKLELAAEAQEEISIMTKLRIWLFVHVPFTFAMFAALLAHIFSVFYYW
ncbi:MAG: hypothetical protein J5J00_04030 [Deltaproteobacteria bacterium]|nr:hypothetical protein [Deltaproteobacteria bacterium]